MYHCGMKGWGQVHPDDVMCVERNDDDMSQPYPTHDGIVISGDRIDLQRSTKVLKKRKAYKKLCQRLRE